VKAMMIGVLCAGILGAGTVTMPVARATTAPAPIPAMEQAIAGATRYQLATATSAIGEVPPFTTTNIVVGNGAAMRVYGVFVAKKNGKTARADEYITGTKVCTRLGTPHFSCKNAPSDAAKAIKSLDPARLLIRPDVTLRVTPGAAKMVQGRTCDGYTLTGRFNTGETSTSMLYVMHGSSLPCELDGTIQVKLTNTDSNGKRTKTYTGKLQWIWSRFNDPSLTIPSIPGS
jgi:hypothetical protein